jgi:hypothetical protein
MADLFAALGGSNYQLATNLLNLIEDGILQSCTLLAITKRLKVPQGFSRCDIKQLFQMVAIIHQQRVRDHPLPDEYQLDDQSHPSVGYLAVKEFRTVLLEALEFNRDINDIIQYIPPAMQGLSITDIFGWLRVCRNEVTGHSQEPILKSMVEVLGYLVTVKSDLQSRSSSSGPSQPKHSRRSTGQNTLAPTYGHRITPRASAITFSSTPALVQGLLTPGTAPTTKMNPTFTNRSFSSACPLESRKRKVGEVDSDDEPDLTRIVRRSNHSKALISPNTSTTSSNKGSVERTCMFTISLYQYFALTILIDELFEPLSLGKQSVVQTYKTNSN